MQALIADRELVDIGLCLFPRASAIVLSGSYIRRASSLVSDVDLLVLDADINQTEVVEREVRRLGKLINFTAYNEVHFLALARSEELIFFWLREIRKLIFGKVLLEKNNLATRTIDILRASQVSKLRLSQLFAGLKQAREAVPNPIVFDASFLTALETLYFLKMHTRIDTLYSKHKYLLEDARNLHCPTLARLLERIGGLYCRDEIALQCFRFGDCLKREFPAINLSIGTFVDDARRLLAYDLKGEAVFPLRYAALRALSLHTDQSRSKAILASKKCMLADQQLSELLHNILLLDQPVPVEIVNLFDACTTELDEEIRCQGN